MFANSNIAANEMFVSRNELNNEYEIEKIKT